MTIRLISHVNADGDLLEAWFQHHLRLGVTSFHLIVHGTREENRRVYELERRFPIVIEDSYEGVFDIKEKKRRVDAVLAEMTHSWVLFLDSDEFLELPFQDLSSTVRALEWAKANVLYAPMLQHIASDGSLETPERIADPFVTFPRCSVDLYRMMGSQASINKFPLFYCSPGTVLTDGGNHNPPKGSEIASGALQGCIHHFKFRRCLLERLHRRIDSAHPFRGESVQLQSYLEQHDYRAPTENSFAYSRRELFRRELLRRPGLVWALRRLLKGWRKPSVGGNSSSPTS